MILIPINNTLYLLQSPMQCIKKAIPIATDYQSNLSFIEKDNSLIYSYKTSSNMIIVKSLSLTSPLFKLEPTVTHQYLEPHLVIIKKEILLFYVIYSAAEENYSFTYHNLAQANQKQTILSLSSIQKQYNELMQIANYYKNAALKTQKKCNPLRDYTLKNPIDSDT